MRPRARRGEGWWFAAWLGSIAACRAPPTPAPVAPLAASPSPAASRTADGRGEALELKGRLETPDGRAASGARVALARGTDVIGDVGVASDGSFTLNVQAGELYVLAATHPEFGAARVAIVPNGATSPLRLSLGKTCPVVHGTLHDEFGQPFVAARVIFWSGAPDPDTPYTVHTDRSGQFAVALSPGSYVISAGDGMKAIAFEHPSHAELELRAFRRPPSVLPASPEELAFVRAHAHPVGQGAAWPEHWLDGALVVGLGQQTHGARQGYELMYRLARELIEQHGFSVIALEAGHAETLALDAWAAPAAPGATNASDDGARQRLDQLASWLWQNTETLDFVRWVRALNGRRPAARRVRFVGLDVQRLAPIASQLELRVRAHSRAELGADPAQLQAELAGAGSCRELPPALGEGAAWARLARGDASAAKLLRDLEQCRAAAASDAARDRALADNAEEATASGRAKVVVLAHNVHVARERLGRAQSAPMGQWLAAALGERYRAVGFLVGRGSFWGEHLALGRGPAAQRGPLELDPVAAGSLEAVLADQDGSYLLPLRESGARWPGPVRKMRDIGAGYAPEYAEYFWSPLVVERSFDALAVVPHTDAIHERPW